MNKKILGITIIVAVSLSVSIIIPNTSNVQRNDKIGLVINSPTTQSTLQSIDKIYSVASDIGIGRSNVYLFWNTIEPERGEFDWKQSDALMGFNQKNNLKVTLYFSIINGELLGPFPNWIGNPPIQSIDADSLVNTLDAILSRYHIVDTVILSGQTESQFRYNEQNIPAYKELFNKVYDSIKEKHPDIQIGNSFALHNVINKNLHNIVSDLIMGDFIAFSYFPVDSLNDIVKTPDQAKQDLQLVFDLAQNKNIGFFEIGWSTSDFVGGSDIAQVEFLEKSFEFYDENESKLEFFTWYRQNDKDDGTCVFEQPASNDSFSVENSALATNEYVIERLNKYLCNSGLIEFDGTPKLGWSEFAQQIKMVR